MRKAKIRLKYAGQCACCGAAIAAGETADYNAAKHEVTHEGGIKGACFSVLNEKANAPAKTHQEQLAAIEGLTFGECTEFFGAKATARDKQIWDMCDVKDEDFESDHAITSEGDDNGSYVLGWRWVSFYGTPLDKEKEEELQS